MLKIALGTHIRTRDDQDVGKVERLIVDPATGTPRALVVHKGFILHHDVEVPFEAVSAQSTGTVLRLKRTADEVRQLPPFEATKYTSPPRDYIPPTAYAADDLLWPIAFDPRFAEPAPEEPRPPMDLKNAVLDAGSQVFGKDGTPLGVVRGVTLDPSNGRPRSFMLRRGHLLKKEELELPADLIGSLDDGVVQLTVDENQLAAYRPAAAE